MHNRHTSHTKIEEKQTSAPVRKDHTGDHGLGSGRVLSGGEFWTAPHFIVRIS